jgi:hypothetical protein
MVTRQDANQFERQQAIQSRTQPEESPQIESPVLYSTALVDLRTQQASDQIAAENEENIDTRPTTRHPRGRHVERDSCDDGDAAQTVQSRIVRN